MSNEANSLKKGVVDRAGFDYSSRVNKLSVANVPKLPTESCGIPNLLANLKGRPDGLDRAARHNAKGPRNG